MSTADPRRALVALLPQFLVRRRRGWPGTPLQQHNLERSAFFLLMAIVRELDVGSSATYDDLLRDLFNPYSTIRPVLDALPTLVERGFLAQAGEHYSVTEAGRALILATEADVQAYVATRTPAPEPEIARLADLFEQIAARLWAAPEPSAKPHQMRMRRLPALPPASVPLVRLDDAGYHLWLARDDAHNAAWRSAGFVGPRFDLLSRVWAGEATSETELAELVKHDQRPDDVTLGLEELIAGGYVERIELRTGGEEPRVENQEPEGEDEEPGTGDEGTQEQRNRGARSGTTLVLTEHGRIVREAIEAETDRIYFTPWPPFSDDQVTWMTATLQRVIEGLDA